PQVAVLEAEPEIVALNRPRPLVLPPRLPAGGTIGLIAPAGVLRSRGQLNGAMEAVEGLGFQTKVGRHVLARHGFLAGTDEQRASDVMAMVQDPEVDAVLAVRGGWGCARILPMLDYDVIAANPKPIVGYSDTTALLLAVYARTGIVTFHGPVGVSTWNEVTTSSFLQTLVEGDPLVIGPETRSNRDRTQTVVEGTARGRVVGGNLTVISALAGTGFLPGFDDHVVFFEEVGEDAYRVDRMLIQLELAGQLREPAGVAFGQCSSCGSGGSSWTAEETIRRRLQAYGRPAIIGAPIGHASPVYTVPIGLEAVLDADAGTLEYVGSAVA
ncbi:S66 peptidase family protein, partial [Rubrivirga sp.]|uniref:S66 peptidase family protein n=1 Tax=Rubrivirga sp. TaxID=1885344 RepID=UPI003C75B956